MPGKGITRNFFIKFVVGPDRKERPGRIQGFEIKKEKGE